MSDFSFGGINVRARKLIVNLKTYDSPLLIDKSNVRASYSTPIVILVEEHFEEAELEAINKFLQKSGCTKYIILNSIISDYSKKVAKDGVIKFFRINRSKFWDYIPEGAPIITSGPALYALLQEDDIYFNHVEQIIFGKSSFWFSPDLTTKNCHRVYPIASIKNDIFGFESLNKWSTMPVDGYRTKLAQIQINNAVKNSDQSIPVYPELNKIFIESKEDFEERFYKPNKDKKGEVLAWDLETGGLNFYKDKIGCITLSFDGITGYYIPWKYVNKKHLGEILKNNIQCGCNLKFDVKFLWQNGVPEARIDEDVLLLGHTLDETRSNSLKSLAYYYSLYGGYEKDLDAYKLKAGGEINYLDIPEEILREYAIMDAIVTRIVWENAMSHCRELDKKYPNEFSIIPGESGHGMEYYYYTFRLPAARMYSEIEYRGVYVDKEKLNKVREDIINAINNLKNKLCDELNAPATFPWESGQQLGILLEKRGWEDLGRTKAGDYATGDYQLSRWKKTHPEAADIEQLKSYNTLLNTFVGDTTQNSPMAEFLGTNDEEGDRGWTQYTQYHPEDNSWRMHPTFLAMMADSGRSRCKNPNTQQIPTRGAFSKEIKSCIKTPNDEDYYLCTVDYASLQLRLCALDSRNPKDPLSQILQGGSSVDMHSNTAQGVFFKGKDIDIEIVTVEQEGKTYEFLEGESVMTDHGEKLAKDLTEEDTLIFN